MGQVIACFEVSSNSIRVLLGTVENNEPVVFCTNEIAIPGIMENGMIKDESALVAALSQLHRIEDEASRLSINITNVYVLLPSLGFQAFRGKKTTNTVGSSVTSIDVSNVLSLFQKDALSPEASIINIIPEEFTLEAGQRFFEAPIDKASRTLTVSAIAHVLPKSITDSFYGSFLKAGFRINQTAVSSYSEGLALKADSSMPQSAIIVNMGGKVTNLTLVMNGMAVACKSCYAGSDSLTEALVQDFAISTETAEHLKIMNGYSTRTREFQAPIWRGSSDNDCRISQKELNASISRFAEKYFATIGSGLRAIEQMVPDAASLPLVLIGGGSMLNGMLSLAKRYFPGKQVIRYSPKVIGARSPRYVGLLGLLLAASRSEHTLAESQQGLPRVSRAVPKEKKPKRTSSPEDDSL